MLIGVFKSNQKIINGLVVLLAIVLWLPAFFSDPDLTGLFSTSIKWLDILLLISLISGQAIYLNFVVAEYRLVKGNSHLTSLFFILLNSCFLSFHEMNEIVIANTLVITAFHQFLRIYNSKNNYSIAFNAGFLIGLAGLIYFPALIYFVLLWLVLIYTTTPVWRDFIISLIGVSVPIIYLVVYQFVFGNLALLNLSDYLFQTFVIEWKNFTLYNQIFLSLLLVVLLFSFLSLFTAIGKSVVKTSKMLVAVFLMFVLGLGTLFLNQYDFLATFLVVSIPSAIIIANFFQNIERVWLAEILFSCLLISMVAGYFS